MKKTSLVCAVLVSVCTVVSMLAAPLVAFISASSGLPEVSAAPGETAVVSTSQETVTNEIPARLTWVNGDAIEGNLVSGTNNSFYWESPLFRGAFELDSRSVRDIVFMREDESIEEHSEPFMFQMISGDVVFGDLQSIDDEYVVVVSQRHGKGSDGGPTVFELNREKIARIVQLENTGMIYMGPDTPENWESFGQEKEKWRIAQDGSLAVSDRAYIYRPLNMPEVINYEVDVSWEGKPNFVFGLNAPAEVKAIDQVVRIETWANELVLSHSDGDFEPLVTLTNNQNELKLQLILNTAERRIVIYDDIGTQLTDVVVENLGRDTQSGIFFQNKGDTFKVNMVNVRRASGFELMRSQSGSSSINLADGTVVNGVIQSFSNGVWNIESEDGVQEVSMDQFGSVTFAGSAATPGSRQMIVRYFDTSHLSGELVSIEEGSMKIQTGYSPEPVSCTLEGMRSIEFPETDAEVAELFEGEHVLIFPGGKFKGQLEEGTGERGDIVRWRPAGAKNGLPIESGDARFVIKPKERRGDQSDNVLDVLYLENRDTIPCQVTAIDDEMVYFESFAERDRVRHSEVRAIDFSGRSPGLPESFEDETWEIPNRGVETEDGAITVSRNSMIAHPALMAASNISFDMQFNSREHTQMTIHLYEENTRSPSMDCTFTFMLWDGQLYATGRQQNMFNSVQELEDNKASIEFVCRNGKVEVNCNGQKIVEETVGERNMEGRGFVIHVNQLENGTSVTFDNLKFGDSAGIESVFVTDATRERILTIPRLSLKNPPTHVLCAENDDLLRGRLVGMRNGTARIVSRMEEFAIPRDKLTSIIWLHPEKYLKDENEIDSGDDADPPGDAGANGEGDEPEDPQANEEVEAGENEQEFQIVVTNGSRLTLVAREWKDGKIVGLSRTLGECEVPLEHIREIRMGSYALGAQDVPYTNWIPKPAPEPNLVTNPETGEDEWGMASSLVGQEVEDFEMKMLDGSTFKLSEHEGKVIVFDFWATWCGPCVRGLPEVIEATGRFDPDEVIFVAVNLQETSEQIEPFLAQR
ncbi:MAG: TlpA disulfide reductase family protein, partial [Planctomycetota bacterium]